MIKQRSDERLARERSKRGLARSSGQSFESLPPSTPVPAIKQRTERVIPASTSQEDDFYIDSDCYQPPPQLFPEPDDGGRSLVYVFRGQRYPTDVDLMDIPWAAGDSEDDEELQQIRYKPRVLFPNHPEDVNSRIKLSDTLGNSRFL